VLSLSFDAIYSPKPFHASLSKASYRSLQNQTARLYLLPSKTPLTEPSAMTPDSMHKSFNPASWKHFPTRNTFYGTRYLSHCSAR